MSHKYIHYIRVAIGIVFLVSGFSKAYDTDYFGSIMASYGIENLYVLAPLIILTELVLGLALIFGIYTRYATAFSMAMVLTLTTIYTYGHIFVDIKDCGCFGHISFMDGKPWLVYSRNILLLSGLAYIFQKHPSDTDTPLRLSIVCVNTLVVFAGAFMCGNTFKWHSNRVWQPDTFEAIALSQHSLHDFVETSVDSTYMVTVFSYTCPHCLNSMGNIEQYEKAGIVDRVIGIAVENPDAEVEFHDVFTPSFIIKNYSFDSVSKLSTEFPISYFIKRDSIIGIMTGEVPSAYFLRHKKI